MNEGLEVQKKRVEREVPNMRYELEAVRKELTGENILVRGKNSRVRRNVMQLER